MSNPLSSNVRRVPSAESAGTGLTVALALALWFALVAFLGGAGLFVAPAENPPLALLAAVASPLLLFLAACSLSPGFRAFVRAGDLRFMTALQGWRIGGFSFLLLYIYGILPGYFAWPAGVGDMAIGISAPWILVALMRRPGFFESKAFVAWNILGILDLVIAVGMGAFGRLFLNGAAAGAGSTTAMARLPLVFVPAFFVPLFIISHLAALSRARHFGENV